MQPPPTPSIVLEFSNNMHEICDLVLLKVERITLPMYTHILYLTAPPPSPCMLASLCWSPFVFHSPEDEVLAIKVINLTFHNIEGGSYLQLLQN